MKNSKPPERTASAELAKVKAEMEAENTKTQKKVPASKNYSTTPPESRITFDPKKIFYSSATGAYFVDVGTHYRNYTRKSPVKTGIARYLADNDINGKINEILADIEIDKAVDWTGSLAGHARGVLKQNGESLLILDEAEIITGKAGEFPLHRSIIEQAFPDVDARHVFLGWLRDGYFSVKTHQHQPAPMLVMAGEANAGKSLLAHIAQQILGGRATNPMTAWSGRLPWNDDMLKNELLLIDDSEASTDPRARNAFGARFKESIYAPIVKINTRGKSSISVRPVWRVMVCCNEMPENLAVIPPLEDDIQDKIILLRVCRIDTPMPARSGEEKQLFRRALRAEMPAFIHFLESLTTPAHLTDSRAGVIAWKDSHLLMRINEISPEHKTESLIALCMKANHFGIDEGESRFMPASEVQAILTDRDSPAASQAREILKYHVNCGRYLSKLRKAGSPYVTDSKTPHGGTTEYEITRPKLD